MPLAERVRPVTLDDYVGQTHLCGPEGAIRQALTSAKQTGVLGSCIFWGPPGTGKTTLANILAHEVGAECFQLSAVSAGVKDVREVIQTAKEMTTAPPSLLKQGPVARPILFIDEIHRFNKSQQDALLQAVEKGWLTLIGATTENPSFEVNRALLSRCQVYVLNELSVDELKLLLQQALQKDTLLSQRSVEIKEWEALLRFSGGDARKLLNLFELVANATGQQQTISITNQRVETLAQQKMAAYDKTGEQHYDIISAFIKSMRGSDPNAALYYLARMIEGGESLEFIARRMLIFSAEDVGNANPNALVLANTCFDAVQKIGYPESRIILAQTVVYLASSPKSNASYMGINQAQKLVQQTGDLSVPLDLRNAPTGLMKDLGYGENYQYAHNYQGNFVAAEFMPKEVKGHKLYEPGDNPREKEFRHYLKQCWGDKYQY